MAAEAQNNNIILGTSLKLMTEHPVQSQLITKDRASSSFSSEMMTGKFANRPGLVCSTLEGLAR